MNLYVTTDCVTVTVMIPGNNTVTRFSSRGTFGGRDRGHASPQKPEGVRMFMSLGLSL